MALFGRGRDVSLFRTINREMMGNVITQQCAFYKYVLDKTKVNMYGEASGGKFFEGPVLLNALITVGDNTSPTSELGVDFAWPITVAFLRDDLVDTGVHPEVGDVILYQESYFEIDNTNEIQFVGGIPGNDTNTDEGYDRRSWSIICTTFMVSKSNLNIEERIN